MAQQKIGYKVEEHIVGSLPELADLLGIEKISKKDITGNGDYADVVAIVNLSDGETEEGTKPAKKKPKEFTEDEIYTALSPEDMKNLESVDVEEIKSAFPEFEDNEELKEFIKDIDTPTLEYLATGLGLEWNPTYHANIHRMRIAMAIQKHFFPELFQPKDSKKKKAKYGDYDTDTLYQMVTESELEVKRTGNDPIDRMKAINALKKAGIFVE
jgi:hypothetical protein